MSSKTKSIRSRYDYAYIKSPYFLDYKFTLGMILSKDTTSLVFFAPVTYLTESSLKSCLIRARRYLIRNDGTPSQAGLYFTERKDYSDSRLLCYLIQNQ